MELSRGIRYLSHARDQMRVRSVTEEQVERVLCGYHTSYPAEPLPHQQIRAIVYSGHIDGRDLKV